MAADGITVRVEGAQATIAAFRAGSRLLNSRMRRTVRFHTSALRTKVRANASGRTGIEYNDPRGGPSGEIGPRVQTGDYRRSISAAFYSDSDGYTGEVFTSAPQGRRLELGFFGSDSLGRTFKQRAYPHFRPAFDAQEPLFNRALAEDLDAVTRVIGEA